MIYPLLLSLLLPLSPADPVRPLPIRHPEAVVGLALCPDRAQFASLSRDGLVILWDIKTRKDLNSFSSPRSAVAIQWLQPRKLVTAGSMGLATLDPVAGKVLSLNTINQRTDAGAISPDGRFAAVGNTHFVGQLLSVETGNSLKPYPAPAEWTYAMDISADSTLLAIGGRNPDPDAITLLETKEFTTIRQWPIKLKDAFGLRFSPNHQYLASVGDGDVVKLWNVADGSLAQSYPLAQPGAIAVCFSPDGKRLAVSSGVPVQRLAPSHFDINPQEQANAIKPTASFVQVWNLVTNKEVWRSEALTTWATSLMLLPNGCLVAGSQDGSVRFWTLP